MNNHFHLVIETPQPNLSLGMKWLLGTYTQRREAIFRADADREAILDY